MSLSVQAKVKTQVLEKTQTSVVRMCHKPCFAMGLVCVLIFWLLKLRTIMDFEHSGQTDVTYEQPQRILVTLECLTRVVVFPMVLQVNDPIFETGYKPPFACVQGRPSCRGSFDGSYVSQQLMLQSLLCSSH